MSIDFLEDVKEFKSDTFVLTSLELNDFQIKASRHFDIISILINDIILMFFFFKFKSKVIVVICKVRNGR